MSKLKKFGISQNINQGITDVMNAVSANVNVRYGIIPLTKIEIDPDNPRELLVIPQDIKNGISDLDPNAARKKDEIAMLDSLAETIKKEGVINPVIVYKLNNENYRLVAGERRLLASTLAAQQDIPAKIHLKKPDHFTLKLLQWVENTERVDLSLKEKINNLKSIVDAYSEQHSGIVITVELIRELTGLSRPQAIRYVAVLQASKDLKQLIDDNRINNLEKAALISGVQEPQIREKVIIACLDGMPLKHLKNLLTQEKNKLHQEDKQTVNVKQERRGRKRVGVELGRVSNTQVVKKLVHAVLALPVYKKFEEKFDAVNWDQYDQASKAFKKILEILEG